MKTISSFSYYILRVIAVWFLGLLAIPFTAHAATITQFSYDLPSISEADFLNDWTRTGIGSWGSGSSDAITLTPNLSAFTYTRNDIPIGGNEAWMFEAVLSAPGLGAAGESGARIWTMFTDPGAPAVPIGPKFRNPEIQLVEDASGQRYFSLVDGFNDIEKASILGNWADSANRFRIRLRRQLVGTDDLIFMETQLADAIPGSAWSSVSVPLSDFSYTIGSYSEFGFGYPDVNSSGYSEWQSLALMASDMPDTLLPPAVPVPPAVWLFGSGLLGLIGVARRKKAA